MFDDTTKFVVLDICISFFRFDTGKQLLMAYRLWEIRLWTQCVRPNKNLLFISGRGKHWLFMIADP